MKAFKSPARWLAGIDTDATAMLLAAAADITVVMDGQSIVRDFAFQSDALALEIAGHEQWIGRPWRDSVTMESRQKLEEMLRQIPGKPQRPSRQVNYPVADGADIPVMFSTMLVGNTGHVIAFGRELRAFATLQQRVVEAQQSFERDYARMRHIETRYRILFQMTPEPVLVADSTSLKIVEANPAARQSLGVKGKVVGLSLQALVEPAQAAAVEAMMAAVRDAGRADDVPMTLSANRAEMLASAFLFRQGNAQFILLRLIPVAMAPAPDQVLTESKAQMLKLVDFVPDGFVVTDEHGVIISVNDAFVEMAQLRTAMHAQGQPLDRWLGRPGVDLSVLLNHLRQHAVVRLFATQLRDEFGTESDVEISVGTIVNDRVPTYGFSIRAIGRRVTQQAAPPRTFPKSLEQIIELIGRVSLKELVREATDVIERLSIEAALTMTGDNRASAAEVLGLSRQSLYVKMRRHGLIEQEAIGLE